MTDPAPARPLLRLVAVLLVALNLRSAISAVAPILGELRADLGLTPAAAGLLTTLPVLCFALWLPPRSRSAGGSGCTARSCSAAAASWSGSIVRVLDGVPVLLGATVIVGAGMTVGNVLVPVVVKEEFPRRAGQMTGLYTAALVTGASIAAALTAPFATLWGWRPALASWGLLAVVAAVVAARVSSATSRSCHPASRGTGSDVALALASRLGIGRVLRRASAVLLRSDGLATHDPGRRGRADPAGRRRRLAVPGARDRWDTRCSRGHPSASSSRLAGRDGGSRVRRALRWTPALAARVAAVGGDGRTCARGIHLAWPHPDRAPRPSSRCCPSTVGNGAAGWLPPEP